MEQFKPEDLPKPTRWDFDEDAGGLSRSLFPVYVPGVCAFPNPSLT